MAGAHTELKPGYYGFDDVEVGDWYRTGGITMTETHVVNFAGVSGDLFDIHMDDEAARENGFPRRIGHGLLGLALTDGLKVRAPVRFASIATLGWNWSFRAPLLIGDRISATIEVREKKATKKPGRGILTLAICLTNQDDLTVQEGETLLMCRAGAAAAV